MMKPPQTVRAVVFMLDRDGTEIQRLRKHKIVIDRNDSQKGVMLDGRPVCFKDGKWVYWAR